MHVLLFVTEMNHLLLLTFSLGVFWLSSVDGKVQTHDEVVQDYLRKVVDNPNYDKRIPPYSDTGRDSPIHVNVSMYILDIPKVDAENKEYEVQFIFRQSWLDRRLADTDNVFSPISLTNVDKIWTPDVYFVSEKEDETHGILPKTLCRISKEGYVLYSIRITRRLSCMMDLRNFPFDVHVCTMSGESYAMNMQHINFNYAKYKINAANEIFSSDFKLLDIKPYINIEYLTTGNYSSFHADLKLKRNSGYFISKLFVPSIILVILSWLALWIAPRLKNLRLTFLLVILYLMVTVASESDLRSPYAPYAKASDVWIGYCEAMIVLLILEFIAVCAMTEELKGEMMSSPDSETKRPPLSSDFRKSSMEKFITEFDLKIGGSGRNDVASRLDRISKLLFPIIFIIFNIVFWSVYSS